MEKYDHKKIEARWQKRWEKEGVFAAKDADPRPKFYALIEFPYPSGEGLHVGHPRSYTAMDIIARKRRMEGYNVLYPIGFDSFGLPTENYAIKTGRPPAEITKENIANFTRQLKMMGFSFDWDRQVTTSDPAYYKWTQWIFLQFFKHDLAYKAKMPINWCPSCKIGLANEEVVDGACERCGSPVEKRDKEQWMLRITRYAPELLKGLETVDYLPRIKQQQMDWIGKGDGALIDFGIEGKVFKNVKIKVFTTRPDTLFGATYLVLAPEHPLVDRLTTAKQQDEVLEYQRQARMKSDLERTELQKEKTGVPTGNYAINPANGERIPIWIADYVLGHYGTGAIMAVPAHDIRDFNFANTYHLEIKPVVLPTDQTYNPNSNFLYRMDGSQILIIGKSSDDWDTLRIEKDKKDILSGRACWTGSGILVNSGKFDGLNNETAKWKITEAVGGVRKVQYKLRDWVFSRQRYWGEPIPIIYCKKCGYVPVPDKDLPVKLPSVEKYQPTDTGESPLAAIDEWVNVGCPKCDSPAKRETDVMPNWAGSSWYFLRYCDPENKKEFARMEKLKYWMGVDWYNGGMEHTVLHLLYSRFWNQFLYDIGVVPTREPYKKRTSHGLILAEDGEKMSKSRGNVVNPNEIVEKYGADVLRVYEMFMGPFDQAVPWSTKSIAGVQRFLERVWNLQQEKISTEDDSNVVYDDQLKLAHRLIDKVSADIEAMKFNTAIAKMMGFLNEISLYSFIGREIWDIFLKLLYPFAPHICEELWSMPQLAHEDILSIESWPKPEAQWLREERFELVIQVDGKVRARQTIEYSRDELLIKNGALADDRIQKWIRGKEVKDVIIVKGKLVNIVTL